MHEAIAMRANGDSAPGHVWRIGAYAVCWRGDEVLVVRASSRTQVEGSWFLPGGGLEFGEAPEAAVFRELTEETGLTGRAPRLLGVTSTLHERVEGTSVFTIRLIYALEVNDPDRPLTHELAGTSDEARWVAYADVEALGAMPYVLVALGLSAK
ncbi:MAG TPA: NUDIX domain-containing protein [Acidimicrobiales bacterium]|nr:NUDIX domain-containing protein [Acidimicrobiales bacterium]